MTSALVPERIKSDTSTRLPPKTVVDSRISQAVCEWCGSEFKPYRGQRRPRWCPGGECKRAQEAKLRRVRAPDGQGRQRAERFECGVGIVELADQVMAAEGYESRQAAVLEALKWYIEAPSNPGLW